MEQSKEQTCEGGAIEARLDGNQGVGVLSEKQLITQNLQEMKRVLPSYIDGQEKFYEQKGKVPAECVRKSLNLGRTIT